jgi:hypothetical protein
LLAQRDLLLEHFEFRPDHLNISSSNKKTLDLITQDHVLCLHIRGGDYPLKTRLNRDYYIRAINSVKLENRTTIVVFTDDKNYTEALNLHKEIILVSNNFKENSYIDLYLMSKARNLIISNSTFSWWAAYLNLCAITIVAPSKFLTIPKRYFKSFNLNYDYNFIYMPNWTVI